MYTRKIFCKGSRCTYCTAPYVFSIKQLCTTEVGTQRKYAHISI